MPNTQERWRQGSFHSFYSSLLGKNKKMLDIITKAAGLVAGVAGTLFVGYCVYFDQQRRKDPDFKKKLRERRRVASSRTATRQRDGVPDMKDHDAVQRYFLQQVQAGEELLAYGNLEQGVEHLCRAVIVCSQPQQLLMVLQQTLPSQVFELILKRLPEVSQQIKDGSSGGSNQSMLAINSSRRNMQDEDVE